MKSTFIKVAAFLVVLLAAYSFTSLFSGQTKAQEAPRSGQFDHLIFSGAMGGFWLFDKKTGDIWVYEGKEPTHIGKLTTPGQQLVSGAGTVGRSAAEIRGTGNARSVNEREHVGNLLRILESAKEQWALENKKVTSDRVTPQDLTVYLRNNQFPVHPPGGRFILTTVGEPVRSTIYGTTADY